jgi:hypothetical protein
MPKLVCPCGYIHNLSLVPDAGWVAVLDRDFEPMLAASARQQQISSAEIPANNQPDFSEWQRCRSIVTAAISRFYECPRCGRLMWQRPGDTHVTVYSPSGSN